MLNKTKIEWCDYTINPVKGLCPMDCKDNQGRPYCYARRMYKRFKWNPEIRYIGKMNLLNELLSIPRDKPAKIFMGSTFELFGDWVKPEWLTEMFELVRNFPFFTFIFLTKQPQNLVKWSPFLDNCWVGVSATDEKMLDKACRELYTVDSKVKFISLEPLLDWHTPFAYVISDHFHQAGINWLIIGSQTQPVQHPPREGVDEIITAADKTKIPVFVKEPMASYFNIHRQEFPSGRA